MNLHLTQFLLAYTLLYLVLLIVKCSIQCTLFIQTCFHVECLHSVDPWTEYQWTWSVVVISQGSHHMTTASSHDTVVLYVYGVHCGFVVFSFGCHTCTYSGNFCSYRDTVWRHLYTFCRVASLLYMCMCLWIVKQVVRVPGMNLYLELSFQQFGSVQQFGCFLHRLTYMYNFLLSIYHMYMYVP